MKVSTKSFKVYVNKKDIKHMSNKRKYIWLGTVILLAVIILIFNAYSKEAKRKEAFNNCIDTAKQICADNNVDINDISIQYSQQYDGYDVYTIYVDGKSSTASMLDLYNLVKSIDNLMIDYDDTLLLSHIKINGNTYGLDVLNEKILTCNNKDIYTYVSEEDKEKQNRYANKYPFVGMREEYLRYTILGEPDSIEKCRDFNSLVPRARSKEYEWETTDNHGWWKVTVFYTDNKTGKVTDTVDLPSDNGIVFSITYTDENGVIQSDYKYKNE